MRAMLVEQSGQPLRYSKIATPASAPSHVPLRVQSCAICPTDLHIIHGDLPLPHAPLVLGHQIVGTVETADVALMVADLASLADGVDLSRHARRIVWQNVTISLGVIAVFAPSATFGLIHLPIGLVAHEGSTLVVVAPTACVYWRRDGPRDEREE